MRVVLQRVRCASVLAEGEETGRIGTGLVALVGVAVGDDEATARRLAEKTVRLRLFPSTERDLDRALVDGAGALLCVSQFTLHADVRRGNRPSWSAAAPAEAAEGLVEAYAAAAAALGVPVARGRFGARMEVRLAGDGPVTILLDSARIHRPSPP